MQENSTFAEKFSTPVVFAPAAETALRADTRDDGQWWCVIVRGSRLAHLQRCNPMPALPITFACGLYDRMLALQTGEIKPDGIDLNFLVMDNPREIFDRMSNRLEFDACEMSSSEFVTRFAAKKLPFVAIPVFASRVFRHGFIIVNRKLVKSAKDLVGKRIGVPLYTQTAAIFIRGLMQHDLGIDLTTIEWVQGAINEPGAYGNPSVMPMLKPVNIKPNNSGKSLSDLLETGEIHAIIGSNLPNALRRNPDVVRLFPDYRAREKDYFRRTKIFPIMHLIVIRNDVYDKNPFVATSLFNAFTAAKDRAREKMRYCGTLRYMLPWLPDDVEEIDELFGGDCWPYGIEPNRPTLEALVSYMVEQGLIPETNSARKIVRADVRVELGFDHTGWTPESDNEALTDGDHHSLGLLYSVGGIRRRLRADQLRQGDDARGCHDLQDLFARSGRGADGNALRHRNVLGGDGSARRHRRRANPMAEDPRGLRQQCRLPDQGLH